MSEDADPIPTCQKCSEIATVCTLLREKETGRVMELYTRCEEHDDNLMFEGPSTFLSDEDW